MLPKAPSSLLTERAGILAVASAVTGMGSIWRETPTSDVGIDGQVEFVNDDGQATGRLIGVQVKAGASYFSGKDPEYLSFYPEAKHQRYWEQYPLPVILILHDLDSGRSYWTDARQQLRGEGTVRAAIHVRKKAVLQKTSAKELFATAGIAKFPFIASLDELLSIMINARCYNGCFNVSFFELFVFGLTNFARSLYHGMDTACTIAGYNLPHDAECGIGAGPAEHDFMFSFVEFVIAQNLAHINFADCLIDWVDRGTQPHFVAPLSSRGRDLVRYIHMRENEFVRSDQLPDAGGLHVAQDAFFSMTVQSYASRLPRVQAFQRLVAPH